MMEALLRIGGRSRLIPACGFARRQHQAARRMSGAGLLLSPASAAWLLFVWVAAPVVLAQGYAPDVAVEKMKVADGLQVTLFASEPEVRQPILVKCDDRGRLWTIQYLQYPNPAGLQRIRVDRYSRTVYDRVPEPPPKGPCGADRITILEDTNGDGKADVVKDFVTGLNLCTGVEFGYGGVFVMQVPYLLFYPDRNRDDVPDGDPEVLLQGFGMEDAQSLANHLTWGPDGWLYGVNGSTTTCNIRGIEFQQGCWRYHPASKEFELFCEGGGNTYGLTFDEYGNLFYSTNGGPFVHAVQGGYFYKSFGKHGPLHNLYAYGYFSELKRDKVPGGPPTGGTIYLGDSFPERFRGTFIAGNFVGHTASWWTVKPLGSAVEAKFGGVLLDSKDTWFGPTDVCLSPDGSLYICDFHDQRTAHPDPDANWDRTNGRIYNVTADGVTRVPQIDLAERTSDELVDLLSGRNKWSAGRARVLLAERRDAALYQRLAAMALQQDDHRLALEGLWGLNASGGFTDAIALRLLDHPGVYVRCWAVRLLGDPKSVSREIAARLTELARMESSLVVRSQLACTAKRLPGADGLPIVTTLLDRNVDDDDPRVPWLLWWAIEDKAVSDMDLVVHLFAREELWNNPSYRGNLRRLVRRYAAEGTTQSYRACLALLQTTPASQATSIHTALAQGLSERSTGLHTVGRGGLQDQFGRQGNSGREAKARTYKPLIPDLLSHIHQYWESDKDNRQRIELALHAGIDDAGKHVLTVLEHLDTHERQRVEMLDILSEFGERECVTLVLSFLDIGQPLNMQLQAIDVLNRFGPPEFTQRLIELYPKMRPEVRVRARLALFSRQESAAAFLELVDQQKVDAKQVPLQELRGIALHDDEELNALVRKHWGSIGRGTPGEKLATIRRFNNDLRAASGSPQRGHAMFRKHCATCHTLFGEGEKIGPDLTSANRGDRAALLANLVDPSAVIRSEYLSYVLVDANGRVLTGLIAEQDASSITLLDAKNERTRIRRDEILELRESPVSLMPEDQLNVLKPQELRDLFAYLQSSGK